MKLKLLLTLALSLTCGLCGYTIKPKEDELVENNVYKSQFVWYNKYRK